MQHYLSKKQIVIKKVYLNFGNTAIKMKWLGLAEGEAEEVNIRKKITKVFDYKEDIEEFGKKIDKIQRKKLTKEETDSLFITTTNVLETLNKVKNNTVVPKEIEANLKELKKEAKEEKTLMEKEDFDIFGSIVEDRTKIKEIANKKH